MSQAIWSRIETPEFDYQILMHELRDYAKPRDHVTTLMKQGVVRRVKKGLYVFGEGYRSKPVSREILSNLIYGPSCISLEYALQYHGLIPERVEAVTAVCLGPSRKFYTTLGMFTYHRVPENGYHIGVNRIEIDNRRAYLIASPEKALADKLKLMHGVELSTQRNMRIYLEENLRIEWDALTKLDSNEVRRIADAYRSRKIRILAQLIMSTQGKGE
ncbi:MAG: hypothetical protein U9Q77_06035 [Candidatus Marinimicrobia bacterium]|nr:hypothetical protein [Candidatus Neomarinimicrobiota bacterium]